MIAAIQSELLERAALYSGLGSQFAENVALVGEQIAATFERGDKLLTCGNGGSAAEAQHLAEELVGRFRRNRRALPALALTCDGTALTCIANDFGFHEIFARQVEALARPGDLVLVLSTSGNSQNLLGALHAARQAGAATAGLLGGDGGAVRPLCDQAIVVPSARADLIQEVHLSAVHLLCAYVEARLGLASFTAP